ncbi:hypothetical protein HWC36_gp54 [Corynebacterium phage StAB]|uniref:Uncharacterized protein n=1 Tax=Corynebacterium phage StAB TaxID=2591204 RepID=A0A514DJK2_9CAUD|nr:hypothetical protein HWC36_gp54 [Corynebacterium phage StAB]QDH93765.1 hypothetical protein SEA_STAB_54 [Corynebacterium phage StAB]
MTDHIPADKVRDLRDQYARLIEDAGTKETQAYYGHVVKDLEALLPAPPRPTLADMTDEERAACLRMQCDTAPNRSVRGFIADVYPGGCRVIERDTWEWRSCSDDLVTPRPDLHRMEWPADKKPVAATALPEGWRPADHKDHGRVVVTSASTPSDGDGYVYILFPTADSRGYDWMFCPTNRLTYLDQEADL